MTVLKDYYILMLLFHLNEANVLGG